MGCSPELLGQRDQNVVKHSIKVGITSPVFRAFSIPNVLVLDEELHEVVSPSISYLSCITQRACALTDMVDGA